MKSTSASKRNEHGFVLLVMLLVMFTAGTTFVLSAYNDRQSANLDRMTEVRYQLEATKQQLLAYAARLHELSGGTRGPGFFPCPDINNDGAPESSCNATTVPQIGRLPQYVDVGAVRYPLNNAYAGIDQQFWYAIGGRYQYDAPTDTSSARRRADHRTSATSTTSIAARLFLDGQSEYVALIIAPGEALPGQNRAGGPNTLANYIEAGTGGTNRNFFTYSTSGVDAHNDLVLGITLDEYVQAVGPSVAARMQSVLEAAYPSGFPSLTTSQFRCQFATVDLWLRPNSSCAATNSGERWSTYTTYTLTPPPNPLPTPPPPSKATLQFLGCNIVFTLTHGAGFTWDRKASC